MKKKTKLKFGKFLSVFTSLTFFIASCTPNVITPQSVPDLNKSANLSKTEQKPPFTIKGEKSEDKVKVTKKNKDVPIEVEIGTENKDISNIPPPKHFSIKALSQTTFYPQEIGTEVSFDVQADYGQPWIVLIQGPKTTVCNTTVSMRVRSTGPISFTLFIPATFPLSGDYNVFIGDRDPYTNAMLNSTLLGNLKINNPRGLTLNNVFETDTQLYLNFSNQTGDLFKYELFGPSTGSTSCLYFSNGTIFINKSVLQPGDYTAKISLIQYPDVSASVNFNIKGLPDLITALPVPLSQRLSPTFDNVPPANAPKVPGAISVIYNNAAKIRRASGFKTKAVSDGNNGHGNDPGKCDPRNPGKSKPDCIRDGATTMTSANPADAQALNAILQKYNIQNVSDGGTPDETEAQMDQDLIIASQDIDGEVPHKLSVHFYRFPETVNTDAIASELRQLSFVRTAYPSVFIETQGSFNLQGQTTVANDVKYNGTYLGGARRAANPMPNETGTITDEKDNWWWFNRFHVFQGWDFYTWALGKTNFDDINLPKPRIAVIDSGFDISPTSPISTNDRPEYEGGVLVEENSSGIIVQTYVKPDLSNLSIVEETGADNDGKDLSHGALVASVLASPRNNNKNLFGIIPGAKIYPTKVKFGGKGLGVKEELIWRALAITAFNAPNLDAINISLGINGLPVNFVPTMGVSLRYATKVNNIPVVLSAGNSGLDLNDIKYKPTHCTSGYPKCLNYGQITVGGTTRDGLKWSDSNYGALVDIVAGARDISGSYFIPPGYPGNSGSSNKYLYNKGFQGTSLAAPMVAATLGMMKKISGGRFSALELSYLVAYSGTVSRSENTNITESKLLGLELEIERRNKSNIVGMRELNVYNALVITYYFSSTSPYIVRLFNTDGNTFATLNANWPGYYTYSGEGNDSF